VPFPLFSSHIIHIYYRSAIIDDITELRKAGLASFAFFYFDFKDASKKAVRSALTSLVVQLAAQSDVYSDILSGLHSEHDSGSKQPSEDALKECLQNMFALPGQPPIFIAFDALDECPANIGTPSPRENALELVEWLDELNYSRLHVCVTSRPEADIMDVLHNLASHTVSLHDERGQKEDIANYIKDVVNSDKRMGKWREEDRELVIDVLSRRADGM
jgi:hypothetical protein